MLWWCGWKMVLVGNFGVSLVGGSLIKGRAWDCVKPCSSTLGVGSSLYCGSLIIGVGSSWGRPKVYSSTFGVGSSL